MVPWYLIECWSKCKLYGLSDFCLVLDEAEKKLLTFFDCGIQELGRGQTEDGRQYDTLRKDFTETRHNNPNHPQFYVFEWHRRSSLGFTMVVQHLIGPACFPVIPAIPAGSESLSVISYNVLLPNSVDGWWNYKMYLPPLSEEQKHWSTWEYRRDLLRNRLALVGMFCAVYRCFYLMLESTILLMNVPLSFSFHHPS